MLIVGTKLCTDDGVGVVGSIMTEDEDFVEKYRQVVVRGCRLWCE